MIWSIFFIGITTGKADNYIQIVDSITGESLPFAGLKSKSGSVKIQTDGNGRAGINLKRNNEVFEIFYTGYITKNIQLFPNDSVQVIKLIPIGIDLDEIIIKPHKEKYSKKNNPAVDLMENIRKYAGQYNPEKEDYYSYDKYEKTLIAINDFNSDLKGEGLKGRMKMFYDYIDTSSWTGKRLLDLIIKEKLSTRLKSNDPRVDKEIITAYRREGIDEIINSENIRIVLEDVIREVDIFNPNINILQNRFVSPLSVIGPDFYKYYITDTVYVGPAKCIELSFLPRNDKSLGFNGKIYVLAEDSVFFVKKLTMRTPHDINLNFLQNLFISQSFEKDFLGNRQKTYDDVCIEMQIISGTPTFYGRKTTLYDNFSYEKREDFSDFYHKLGNEFNITDTIGSSPEFWNLKRMIPLSYAESRLGNITSGMRTIPIFYWTEKFIGLMESGYFTTGKPSKFDIGPLNTLISYDTAEGIRLRLGGMTMSAFNPHFFMRGYVAYGTKDKIWKYNAELEYSFARKKSHSYEWPRHGFYGQIQYDIDQIGQHYLFTNQDNIFLSLKRKENNLVTYRHLFRGGYILELPNNFSVEAGLKFEIQKSTPWLPFILNNGSIVFSFRQSAFNVSLRWAKGEKFYQGRSTRMPVNMDAWIFQLTQEYGPKKMFGASFTLNRTEFSLQKRFWFSAFGYLDLIMKTGKIWSSVYYPALLWQNANLSYTIQPESYSLLNPMEFAMDSYISVDFTYFGNGILFNRIPLINHLKLREAITFKGFLGDLSDKNNPSLNPMLYRFPEDANVGLMTSVPYMEISAGLDNIFSVLRVDYVWRLTYRNKPGVDRGGIRISLHFTL